MRYKYAAAAVFLMIALGCAGYWFAENKIQLHDDTVIALVNGEPIAYREMLQVLKPLRSTVSAEKLKENALDELVKIKIEQLWAKQKGLVDQIDYEHFRANWINENNRRKEALAKKEPVYGPKQYTEGDYYRYLHTNLQIRLKEAHGKEEFVLTSEQLIARYESTKERTFKKPASIRIQKIVVASAGDAAQEKINQAAAKLAQDEDFEQVAQVYSTQPRIEQFFDASRRKIDLENDQVVVEIADKLVIGQISDVIQDRGMLMIIKCIERVEGGYEAFDKMKANLQAIYTDEQFGKQLEARKKEATVDIRREAYDRVKIDAINGQ
ncbi:hypothetical protein GK047_00880 [Paenibacillus sp. SYP-B3998]|uniref:peptidylprolyl isomerase n=1 Tax=Paenibacillus sp. SYP-B3998 TaxID=2678564 RepID=A0A6G3ZT33_9BACL|nr:peptidyl-prolyl cis-trans isomerase [Paenibacillus sp. SYP-B3998]NEW04577.1 hypothetical protein [Paenibacillus sp. SYP-B3998]